MPSDIALDYQADFRGPATVASMALLGSQSNNAHADLTRIDASLCLPSTSNPEQSKRTMRRRIITTLTIIFSTVALGGLLSVLSFRPELRASFGLTRIPIWIGPVLFALGWIAMSCSVDIECALARLLIEQQGARHPPFSPTEKVCIARMEDPATYKTVKVMIDDIALLYCDASRSLILLEGICYRYLIRAQDIVSCARLGDRFVQVDFKVANSDQILSLAISRNSALEVLKKQLSGGSATPAMKPLLERTFGRPIPDEAHVVTISQLGAATASSPFFNYVGSDNEFHHFVGTDGAHFRVHLADWPNPSPLPYNGKFSLFMTVKDGKLTAPDAKVMSDLMQNGLVRPPSGMAQ